MNAASDRAIRVLLFGGPYLEPCALRFAVLLEEQPRVELVAVLCQAAGAGLRHRLTELWRRRGAVAPLVLGRELLASAGGTLRAPAEAFRSRASKRRVLAKILTVPDVHAPEVLERVRVLAPDLGAIYGAPVLRPQLFEIPRLGTLGIHHGRVPHYRGKKTTFWEVYNGEAVAGVTIQRVNAGIDTGAIVKHGDVPIGRKSYGRVERETQALGLALYVEAILDVQAGRATFVAQPSDPHAPRRHYRQPSAAHVLRLWLKIAGRRLGWRRA